MQSGPRKGLTAAYSSKKRNYLLFLPGASPNTEEIILALSQCLCSNRWSAAGLVDGWLPDLKDLREIASFTKLDTQIAGITMVMIILEKQRTFPFLNPSALLFWLSQLFLRTIEYDFSLWSHFSFSVTVFSSLIMLWKTHTHTHRHASLYFFSPAIPMLKSG